MGALRTNVIGSDDAPFAREHRGDVPLVGVICARTRVDGLLGGKIRRDGANATRAMIAMIEGSQFREHVRCVLLQCIAVGGFNVLDVHALRGVFVQRVGITQAHEVLAATTLHGNLPEPLRIAHLVAGAM